MYGLSVRLYEWIDGLPLLREAVTISGAGRAVENMLHESRLPDKTGLWITSQIRWTISGEPVRKL
jgi:hypothetical protein